MGEKDKGPATYADIEAAPEHLGAEIIDGVLRTHPRPSIRHGATASALGAKLSEAFQFGAHSPGGSVFCVEPEIKFGDDFLVPDIAGWRRERLLDLADTNYFQIAPDWVCEVLSGSTEKRDRTVKKRIYGKAGVPHMWIVDPRLQVLEVFELLGDHWLELGTWNTHEQVSARPFDAISISLADLWPLDPPLGLNEDPTPYYAGDR